MDDTSSGPPVASLPSGLQHRCRCPKPEGSTKQRKLIVCIDGTSNRFGPKNTNVVEFYSQIIKSDDQLTYYNSGIGTLAKPSWKSWSYFKRRIASYADQAIAWNLDHVLLAAYKWLANSYKDGDQIFLFGFSRGAYQVRILAAMIHEVGLILPGNDEQIPFAFETYCALEGGGNRELAATFKKTFSRKDVCAHFVGAWDTVSSVGFLRGKTFPSTTTSKEHMCFFRHALALDERRVKFLPEYIYGGQADQLADGRVKEVWFYGSHSDVGGGNTPNADLRSGNISLLWMRKEAEMAGLELEQPEITWLMKDLNNTNVESLTGPWWLAEVLPLKRLKYHASALHDSASGPAAVKLRQTPNFGNGRVILPGQKIHASVLFKPAYKPKARFLNNDIPWPEVMHFDDPESPERLSRLDSGVWEKDLFDNSTASFLLKKLVNYTKEGKENLDYLDQLVFMSRSEDGRQAIVKVPNSLVTVQGLMENANANVRLSGLVIYCELGEDILYNSYL
ncbi:hypothetical protein BS17DRAFT_788626 [Gyrodon lividus]|nr:hypothetical protein BS17DRAFT_788626 [Gyrodon lividus]